MKYFGTDGIRGIFGDDLTIELASKVANAIVTYKPKKIIVGYDTRESSPALFDAMAKVFTQNKIKVVNVGVAPTMAVAFLTRELGCDYGVMITASHNPPKYNGIKVFDKKGEKLDGQELEDLDRLTCK